MNLDNLLLDLSSLGVKIWAEGDQLRLRAPKGVITPELQNSLSDHKTEILDLLRQERAAERGAAAKLRPVPREGGAPLSFMQERLLFLSLMYPHSPVYNLPNARRMRGRLHEEALRSALQTILERHEILRTTFRDRGGNPVQIVSPSARLDFESVDVTTSDDPEAEATRIALIESERAFDLATGPLLRTKLLKLGPDDHLFFWCLYHIVSDGWSSMVFLRELKAFYEQQTIGTPANVPALSVQFGDFAVWEREWLQGEFLESQLSYWRKKLGGRLTVLDLPADHPRSPMLSYQGRCHSISFSMPLVDSLKSLAQRTETTLFMVLLTAFKILLHRYTALTDICVGTPVARRNRREVEDAIGCFINTLALRTDLSGEPRVVDLLGRVRETCIEAFGRQDVPFEKLVEELQPDRDLSHTPIFQVMLILHVQDTRKVSKLGDIDLSAVEYHASSAKFDLTLELKETGSGLEGWFEYSTDLFEESTIGRMASQLETLLWSIVEEPERRISELRILPEADRHRLLVEWNATAADYPWESCVHGLIGAQAERSPKATAVVFGEDSLSYRELEERSNRLARYLVKLGVGVEIPVGLYVERSLEMVVGLLGVLKAGGAYLPLDPSFPKDRLAFMVRDAGVPVILSQSALVASMPEHGAKLVELDGDGEAIAREDGGPVTSPTRPDTLAYIIYTSGSTGKPKGVCIAHRALANLLHAMREHTAITEEDSLLAVTTLSFDIAALELYLPLIAGARLVLASRETAADGESLSECLADCRITLMQATPATWRLLIEAGWQGSGKLRVLCGGETLPRELADQLLARCPSLSNLYGPTETTIWSSAERVRANQPISIGRPLANTEIYILDGALNPVPIGVPGELHIAGAGLARGYLNRPELTAEKFISHPFSDDPNERLYKTGDLARYRADSSIEFLGRIDSQVKLRGFRIELGEIEACLRQHPKLREAAVLAREDHPGDKRLTAYIVPNDLSSSASADELRSFLKDLLPEYMLPSSFVALDQMPLMPNGKLDRKALPAPDRLLSDSTPVAPRTPLERQVAAIFAKVLKIDQVGIRDNFFDLGGHSFLVLRVLAEIEKACGRRLSVATLFQAPTVEEIGQILAAGDSLDESDVVVPLNPHGTTPPLFSVWMGIATMLREFCGHLGAEETLYGISSHWDPMQRRMTRIEEMAAYNLTHLRKVQPHGPYYLSSDCVATLIVLEMAQQLLAQGEEIAALVLIDPLPPRTYMKMPTARDRYRSRVERHLRRLVNPTVIKELAYVLVIRIAIRICMACRLPLSRGLLWRYIRDTHQRAKDNYVPRAYAGKIWFIWAADDMDEVRRREIQNAWSRLAAQATHRMVPGAHVELFTEPRVGPLAEQMRICLAEARRASHTSTGVQDDAAGSRHAVATS